MFFCRPFGVEIDQPNMNRARDPTGIPSQHAALKEGNSRLFGLDQEGPLTMGDRPKGKKTYVPPVGNTNV